MQDFGLKGEFEVTVSNQTLAKVFVACVLIFVAYFTVKHIAR